MGRRGTKTNRVKAPGRAARGQGGAAAAEEEDLSEDLQDYLQNVAQVSISQKYHLQQIRLHCCCLDSDLCFNLLLLGSLTAIQQ